MTRRLLSERWVLAVVLAFTIGSPIVGAASSGHSKALERVLEKWRLEDRPHHGLISSFEGPSKTASSKSGGQKTVHVKEYTKKDGTKVAGHDRKAPHSKTAKASAVSTQPRDAKGRFVRSESAKRAFEAQTGFPHGRPGYVIDHVKPLACGGADAPSNMQWQTVAAAKAKDKVERIGCK